MSEPLRVLIVDDDPQVRARLSRFLAGEAGVEVVGEAGPASEARALIEEAQPDVLLLDIRLLCSSGFELLSTLQPGARPEVIFVSAQDDQAVRAFSVGAVDHLVKPFGGARLRAAIERAREAIASRAEESGEPRVPANAGYPGEDSQHLTRFVVRGVGRMLLIDAAEVDWIEAAGNYIRIHHAEQKHLMRGTMNALEGQLDPRQFARIHRSTIVNLDRVRELQHILHGDYFVFLRDGTRLTLSRGYRESFERAIAGSDHRLRRSG